MTDNFSLHGVERTVLPNGLVVLARRDTSAPVVSIVTYVNAGYFDESDDVVGIAHVLEHMFFKGTARRGVGEIARQTKSRGGYLNAHTIYDHTAYFTVLPASAFEAGMDIQSDAFINSSIDAQELAKELEVIIQEAKRKLDSPGAVASETLNALMHDVHRIRRWRIGKEEGLRALTRDALLGFYRTYYRPRNTVVVIVGDVDTGAAFSLASRYYGGIPDGAVPRDRGPRETRNAGFRYRDWDGDISQAQLALGWRTPGTLHADTPALDLLAMTTGSGRASRLYRAVRDRKLASSIGASNYTPTEIGVFNVHAELDADRIRDAMQEICAQLDRVRDGDVQESELARAKRGIEARRLRRFESMDGQAMWLASWESLGGWQLGEEYFGRMMSLTREDVVSAARRYLDPAEMSVVSYRPRGSTALAPDIDALREMLQSLNAVPLRGTGVDVRASPPALVHPVQFQHSVGKRRVYRTRTGVPILVQRLAGSPIMHAAIHIRGGSCFERDDTLGLTLLMARSAIKGTRKRTAEQIASELELNGGALAPSVGTEGFGWAVSAPLKWGAPVLDILAEVVQEPALQESAVDVERDVLQGEIAQARDDMYRQPLRLALDAAYGKHPYGRPVSGTAESVQGINAATVRSWHDEMVLKAPIVLGIVADADEDELAAQMGATFGGLEWADPAELGTPPWPDSAQRRIEEREKAQTAIALAFPSASRVHPDRHVADMIATIGSGLGGRFFDELRDRQSLAYTVHAYAAQRALAGTFVAYIATSPEQEERATAGLRRELEKLAETEVTPDEIAQAREYILGTHAIRLQSGGAVLSELIDAWTYGTGLAELERVENEIRGVSARRILEFARDHFDMQRIACGIVRGKGAAR